jgi:DNA-directed RNA polymerase specialized sigma24 family protein
MKKAENENIVVELLFNRDETALPQLYLLFADDLLSFFVNKVPFFQNDPSDLEDIITDSLFALSKRPEKYNPQRASLKTFIFKDVYYNILNFLRDRRGKKNIVYQNTVELNEIHGNIIDEISQIDEIEKKADFIEKEVKQFFANLFPSDIDQTLAWMIEIEKVRETKKFGTVLNIVTEDPIELEKIVKQHKDRIKAKLKRSGYDEFKKNLRSNA